MSVSPDQPTHGGDPADLSPPSDRVLAGRYRLVSTLGAGQAAVVSLAHDLNLGGRLVAVKVARAGAPASDHLVGEARALALIEHPAVPRLLDMGRGDGRVALVLEYLPGQLLSDICRNTPADEGQALEWVMRLCDVLIHLDSRPQPLTHGAVRAEHCMVLPTGRLVLLDFGTAAPATTLSRRQDTLAVALLLHAVLTGHDHPPGSPVEPPRHHAPGISPATEGLVLRALQPPAGEVPLTLGTLRRLLLECRQSLGLRSGICLYCQASTRADARHCRFCGSPLFHEPLPGPPPELAIAPPLTAPLEPPLTRSFYQNRLRVLGRLLDRQPLGPITIRESPEGFSVRGAQEEAKEPAATGPLRGMRPRPAALGLDLRAADLDAQALQARQQRAQPAEREAPPGGEAPPDTLLFPTGYEDGLRALGYQLDARGDVQDLVIAETPDGLLLDYHVRTADPSDWALPRHLVLTPADMEAILAEGVDRRGSGERGESPTMRRP